jgi:ParB family chromosome partitioning protein
MARQALGKGLNALIPTQLENLEHPRGAGVAEVPLSKIRPNRFQPRKAFSQADLKELADSIAAQGVLQPVLLRRDGEGFELISGERRLRAMQALGRTSIPAVVRESATDEEMAEWALVENVQRTDLNPMEEARGYARLIEEFKLSQEDVAAKVGRDRSSVANTVRLLKLPAEVQALVQDSRLSAGHAKALLSLENAEQQKALGLRASREGWSVRQVERAAGAKTPGKAKSRVIPKDVNLAQLEDDCRRALGTKVRIRPGKKGGSIEIEYYSPEELERLIELFKK